MKQVLDETRSLLLTADFETAELKNKITDEIKFVGDHYGDPSCGAISEDENFCVSGGEGVVFSDLSSRLTHAFRVGKMNSNENFEFQFEEEEQWLTAICPKGPFFVHALRFENAGQIRVLLDPWSEYASTWLLDIEGKSIRMLKEGPDLRDRPRFDNVVF